MMTLAKRKYNMADEILMQIMVEAYPIIVFTKQLEDGSRKIMQIIEGEDYRDSRLFYRTLYQYDVIDNRLDTDGSICVVGRHIRLGSISEALKKRMLDNGIPAKKLLPFLKESSEQNLQNLHPKEPAPTSGDKPPLQTKNRKGGAPREMDSDHSVCSDNKWAIYAALNSF